MSSTAQFIRGSTFSVSWDWNPETGTPANLIGATVEGTLRDSNCAEYDLTIAIDEDGLGFVSSYGGDTFDWAVGSATFDFLFTFSGGVKSKSTPFRLTISDGPTR